MAHKLKYLGNIKVVLNLQIRGEKCTKMLLKSGADTNMAMADGRTPLHISSESGTLAVLRQLLANGADPLLVDSVSVMILAQLS